MIRRERDTKVFVHCPAGVVTGGTELLHQMTDVLRRNGVDARVVYFGDRPHVLPAEYEAYDIVLAERVENDAKNIEVVCETAFDIAVQNGSTQKVMWWLSVDNFYNAAYFLSLCDMARWNLRLALREFARRCYFLVFRNKNYFAHNLSLRKLAAMNAVQGYQSEYAQNFLQSREFEELVALKDYINTDHVAKIDTAGRRDRVLYNPKKGLTFTRKLIAMTPDIEWVPIQNMPRAQLVELMRSSKLYVDFGFHPGKDRLPRECAMNGCCIITGKRGSAAFYEDVPIDRRYKFDEKTASKKEIVRAIRQTLEEYEQRLGDFEYYRRAILGEKEEFERQVKSLFEIS